MRGPAGGNPIQLIEAVLFVVGSLFLRLCLSVLGPHFLRGCWDDDQCPDGPSGTGAPHRALHAAAQPSVGRHDQPGHSKRGGSQRPGCCQAVGKYSENKRAGMQGSWSSICGPG